MKIQVTTAGFDATREATFEGVSINAMVSFCRRQLLWWKR